MDKESKFTKVKCVTLDLDDTLWPVGPTIIKAEQALYDWMRQHYPELTQKYSHQEITDKRTSLGKERQDLAYDVTLLRHYSLNELGSEFGYDPDFADKAMAIFRHYRNQVEPYEHSESLLTYLQQHFIVGAITNGNVQMENISLGRFFDFVVTAEDVGVNKPDAKMFIYAAKQANVNLGDIVHIGDSPKTDVLGALNAGCRAIWFNDKRQPWPGGQTPDEVVHCLSELPQILGL